MRRIKAKSDCGRIGEWFAEALANRLDATTSWMQRHIANCPRCRRQAIGHSRLRMGLLLIKTQPHGAELLALANRSAIGVLRRGLRELPKAEKLRHASAKPALHERLGKYTQSVGHAAACLGVLLLLRVGIFSSLEKVDEEGQEFVKNYCARLVEQGLIDDVNGDFT